MSPRKNSVDAMKVKKDEQILADIIGATNLVHPNDPKQNEKLHPFAVIKLHEKGRSVILRRTKREKDTNNPIWCVHHRSLFLIEGVSGQEEIESEYYTPTFLEIEIRHKDALNPMKSTILGVAYISMATVWKSCNEERLEFDLMPASGSSDSSLRNATASSIQNFCVRSSPDDTNNSKVSIRFRIATEFDLEFMGKINKLERKEDQSSSFYFGGIVKKFEEHDSDDEDDEIFQRTRTSAQLITEANEKAVSMKNVMNFMNHSFRKAKKGKDGVKRMRVKPYPDPTRKEETMYLSKGEIEAEMYKPSTNWTEVGYAGRGDSNSLGTVYLEILKCQDLPSMDIGEGLGNLTDSFACVVFEDSIVETEVIDDELSPIWLPWTQRAFSFDITHPFSPMFISILDHDFGPSDHDGIGRIAVDLNQFEMGMIYTLQYALYPASNVTERKDIGKITIRIRKEIKHEKAFLLAALKPQPCFHLHMQTKKTLPVANFTCFGIHNEETYDLTLLRSYINELVEMKRFLFYAIGDSINSLFMWRGQVQVGPLVLPLHSAIAFFGGIYVVERPHLIPGFFFLSIAWIMLASMSHRIQHPSPWQRVKPFSYYLSILLYGKSFITQPVIKKGEGFADTAKLNANWKNRIETDVDAVWKAWEMDQELENVANEILHTKETKTTGDPMELILAPLESYVLPQQVRLRGYCDMARRIKAVATWEESMTSFWVTFPCIIIGVVLLILPTTFLLQWTCRLLIWGFLGPWYRIFCEMRYKQDGSLYLYCDSEDDRKQHKLNVLGGVSKEFEEKGRIARIKGEEAAKLKAMRVIRNGKYISRIPSRNHTRHYDYPEALESHALMMALNKDQELPPVNYNERKVVSSQRLEGKMIPMTIEQSEILLQEKTTILSNDVIESTDECARNVIEGSHSSIPSITEDAVTAKIGKDDIDCRNAERVCEDKDMVLDSLELSAYTFPAEGIRTEQVRKGSSTQVLPTSSSDEEGLEVIDFAVSMGGNYQEKLSLDSDHEESRSINDGKSLSTIYKSSDTVNVAFCRN